MYKNIMALCFCIFCIGGISTTSAAADPYTMVIGDRITLSYNLLETPKTAQIDLDGNIRLPELGSITAAGKSFDQVEEDITLAMLQGGFSGLPSVSVEISEYAPITVSGFVEDGGRYEFIPGITVGVAVAMSGGAASSAPVTGNSELASLAARRRASTLAGELADTVTRIARLEAALAGPNVPITLADALLTAVPRQGQASIDERLARETSVLENERQTAQVLIASWTREADENGVQLQIIEDRIALKSETIERLEKDLSDARSLQSQGLTTNARTLTAIQRLADEREDLLALETAKINTRRARELAERNRKRYEAELYQSRLEQLRDSRSRLEAFQSSYRIVLSELALLYGDVGDLATDEETVGLNFTITGPRADRFSGQPITGNTPLLPGDILIVGAEVSDS